MDHFIQKLSDLLQQPLPGWTAQKHLMPEGRKLERLGDNLHPAAVLISLYQQDGEWLFPLIRRTIDGFAQIIDFFLTNSHLGRIVAVDHIGGTH